VINPEVLSLNAVLENTEKLVRRLVGPKVEILMLLDARAGAIHADPHQVQQVVMNLAVNARDAMPSGGRLTIETYNVDVEDGYVQGHLQSKPGPYVVLAMTDSGSGMDERTKKHLFEPFFTTKSEGKGTGLGLATVHGIVRQSGGDIFVYSERNQGTTFKIYFPRVAAPPAEARTERQRRIEAAGPKTILLVEDDPAIRALAYSSLREVGHTVLVASSAEEADRELDGFQGDVDVLVTDVDLPGVDGFALAERVRARMPRIRVLVVSGYNASRAVQGENLPPGVSYLAKPFGPLDLQQHVADVSADPQAATPPEVRSVT
jgi:two-component system, cell cycle sensor histidine kinase and response regulator CckA